MVWRALNRSLRAASCWSVLVMKGGLGLLSVSLFRTSSTAYSAPSRSEVISLARSPSETFTLPLRSLMEWRPALKLMR